MLALFFKNRSNRSRTALSVAALALFVSAGCGGTLGSKVGVNEVTAHAGADGVQAVEIEVHSFYFKPNRIIVQSGKPVDLTLKFKPLFVPHDLTCQHPDDGISIHTGKGVLPFDRTKHARFTPMKPGEYAFFCSVGNHMMKGMTGSLVVR